MANENIQKNTDPKSDKEDRGVTPPVNSVGKNRLHDDVKKILEEARLPERKNLQTKADNQPTDQPRTVPPTQSKNTHGDKPEQKAESTMKQGGTTSEHDDTSTKKITSVHTLKDDLQSVIRSKKMSLVKAVSLEQDKRRGHEHITQHTKKVNPKVVTALISAASLIAIGALGVLAVLYVSSEKNETLKTIEPDNLIFTEQSVPYIVEGQSSDDILRDLSTTRFGGNLDLGSITQIIPVRDEYTDSGDVTRRPLTTREFFEAIGAHTSDDLLRSFGNNFFLGVHTIDANYPLLIIPVTSYERAFAGMLKWEKNMNIDLAPLFTPLPTTFYLENNAVTASPFEDLVIRNFDVRILFDEDSGESMLYAFPSRNILIIAESAHSFVEALARLRAAREI